MHIPAPRETRREQAGMPARLPPHTSLGSLLDRTSFSRLQQKHHATSGVIADTKLGFFRLHQQAGTRSFGLREAQGAYPPQARSNSMSSAQSPYSPRSPTGEQASTSGSEHDVPWYVRYTRWRPTSRAEGVLSEKRVYERLVR